MVSISIENLKKSFGKVEALKDISLDIKAGELFFLLGPSGCGKTTLLRHIAGFYQPDAGRVLFGDKDVTALPAHKRNTAMMFQSYALWPHMNVGKNVAFGLEERKVGKQEIKKRVSEALEIVQMGDYASRSINQLSGGQQQRVALARALVVRPDALLLDEPLSNLDAKLRLEMRGEIRRICTEFGLTGIYVTHDRAEALSIADRMAILDGGHIAQVGTPLEVYRSPINETVAGFIGETNLLPATITGPGPTPGQYEASTANAKFSGRPADPHWEPQNGESTTLSIRPESFRLVPETSASGTIKGTVREAIYLGEIAQYEIEIEGGHTIRIAELNPRTIAARTDESVHISADPEDVVLLRA